MKELLLLSLLFSFPIAFPAKAMDCLFGCLPCFSKKIKQEKLNQKLLDAVSRGDLKTIQDLIDAGADVNNKNRIGNTPQHLAVKSGNKPIIDMLLQAGADLNIQDNNGQTPLHHAVHNQKIDIVAKLIKAGADLNSKDNDGQTPLHHAIHNQKIDIVIKLIKAGADLNSKDNNGQTPLYHAVHNQKIDIIIKLIKAGADLNIQGKWGGWTPLHLAVHNQKIDIVIKLIKAGASIMTLDKCDRKPSDLAKNNTIKTMLTTTETNLKKIIEHPSVTEEELNKTFTDTGIELEVLKIAYLKMLYHGTPIKLKNNDKTYFIDLCTVYKYFIENNKINELKALVKQHGFTDEESKKLGWGFFPSKVIFEQKERLLTTQQNNILTDVIVHCKK